MRYGSEECLRMEYVGVRKSAWQLEICGSESVNEKG